MQEATIRRRRSVERPDGPGSWLVERPERRPFALLMTDIVDSTRAVRQRSAMPRWPTSGSSTTRSRATCWPQWRGREIDRSDGFLLLFEAAADAVGFRPALPPRAGRRLRVPLSSRAGLHVGRSASARTAPSTSRWAPSRSRSTASPSRSPHASCRSRRAARRSSPPRRREALGADRAPAAEPRPLAPEGRDRSGRAVRGRRRRQPVLAAARPPEVLPRGQAARRLAAAARGAARLPAERDEFVGRKEVLLDLAVALRPTVRGSCRCWARRHAARRAWRRATRGPGLATSPAALVLRPVAGARRSTASSVRWRVASTSRSARTTRSYSSATPSPAMASAS